MKRALLLACLAWAVTATAQVPTYVPTDGLVSYLSLEGSLEDEFGGSGSVFGATSAVDRFGISGGCLQFSGNDWAEIQLTEWDELSDDASFTIACWVYADQLHNGSMIEKWAPSASQPYPVNFRAVGDGALGFGMYGAIDDGTGTHTVTSNPVGEWKFVVGNFDFATRTIRTIINLSDSTVRTLPDYSYSNSEPVTLGRRPNQSGRYFYGRIDDIALWNRSLTSTELSQLFFGTLAIGCTAPEACNYDAEATVEDGSCIPSGCMEEGACNFNADAECEGEACDYSCCPGPGCCGVGMHWDADEQTCVITPPSVAPDAECTMLNLQELAEGYQILLAENAAQNDLILALQDSLSNCSSFAEESSATGDGPCAGQDHVTFDGYDYSVVGIGDQCWFAENLRAESYADGSTLDPAHYAAFNNAPANIDSYGLLYKGAAITDPRNLCPTDWHISTLPDWQLLDAHAAANGHAGAEAAALKSTSGWSTTGNGSDAFGFNATPGGFHYNPIHPYWGEFAHSLTSGYWWTSTPHSAGRSYAWTIQDIVASPDYPLSNGLSVRCVKD